MLKLVNYSTGEHRLTVEYQDREYHYKASRISSHIGKESWFVWAANNRMMQLIYNTATKELKEDLMPGQPSSIPEEFMKALQQAFANSK